MLALSHLPANGWSSSLTPVFLLSLRLASVFLMTPVLYAMQLPSSARLLIVFSLAVVLGMGLPLDISRLPSDTPSFIVAAAMELALGATLGLGIHVAFATFAVAGRLLDIQVGFGMAQVLDPVTRRQIPVLNAAFTQIGVLFFFLLNGHHALLRGVALSLEKFPLGASWPIAGASDAVVAQMTGLFALGFALAAPVVFCVLLAELALVVVARNLPQMNIFVLALPVKIAIALVTLSLWFSGIGGVMTRVYASIATNWEKVMLHETSAPTILDGSK